MRPSTLALLVATLLGFPTRGGDGLADPTRIEWGTRPQAALSAAAERQLPVLIAYGDASTPALAHPLVVEAAETLFVALRVAEDGEGAREARALTGGSPAHRPAIRIVSAGGEVLAKIDGETIGLANLTSALATALVKSGGAVPPWLALLVEEAGSREGRLERATFAMHCFWEGEAALAAIPGVVQTRPGFLQKLEVVEVEFDPERVDYVALLRRAREFECASRVFARSDEQHRVAAGVVPDAAIRSDEAIRLDKEPKYYLSRTPLRAVPMTELQAARVNARIGKQEDAADLLSPWQRALAALVLEHPEADWPSSIGASNLARAWARVRRVAAALEASDAGR